ncbi:hypothetical protein FQZ97_508500 [compost metagenome]
MNAKVLWDFFCLLVQLRTALAEVSDCSKISFHLLYGRAWGFVDALRAVGAVSHDEAARMHSLVWSAFRCSGKPFPDACNAGPVMPSWIAFDRLQQAREVTADAPIEVPAPTAPRVLYLLCMRSQPLADCPTIPGPLQPVHTLHRVPPYASVSGSWGDAPRRRHMETGFQYLSCGTGFYLRKAPARAPSPEVLARCVRQWQADAFRPRLPSIAACAA